MTLAIRLAITLTLIALNVEIARRKRFDLDTFIHDHPDLVNRMRNR